MRTHTKEKPFQCQVCSKTYTRQCVSILPRGSGVSDCSLCVRDTLLRHLRSHHVEQKSYEGSVELQCGLLGLTPHTDAEVVEGEVDMPEVNPLSAPAYTGDQATGTSSTSCFVDDENTSNDFSWLPQWSGALDPLWDSWFIGEDFDFAALDLYSSTPVRSLRQPVQGPRARLLLHPPMLWLLWNTHLGTSTPSSRVGIPILEHLPKTLPQTISILMTRSMNYTTVILRTR